MQLDPSEWLVYAIDYGLGRTKARRFQKHQKVILAGASSRGFSQLGKKTIGLKNPADLKEQNVKPFLTSDMGTGDAETNLPGPDCPRFGAPRECSSLCHPEEPCIITESGTCQESMAYYQCKCGHAFSEELGKYGCPNCEGDSGPAELKQTPSISNE